MDACDAAHYMQLHFNEHRTATQLAEATAIALGHDEWLDDETHWIWDLALSWIGE